MNSMKSQEFSTLIKQSALKMVAHANSSHIGSCFSIADVISVIYTGALNISPQNVDDPDRDKVILSKGHAAAILYSGLAHAGFFDPETLNTYCDNGSPLSGHATHCNNPGVELSTGSLGHGLPVGIGFALAAKHKKSNAHAVVILSDGECDEGSNWEGFLFAPQHNLSNLIVVIDYNKIQSFGRVEDVINLEPFADKLSAFNWNVIEINGHMHGEISAAFAAAKSEQTKPTVIIAHTVKGKGVSFMEDQLIWHYKSPNKEQLQDALAELNAEEVQ